LDDLAVRLGVAKLSDFFDYTEMARKADAELEAAEIRDGLREDTGDDDQTVDVTAEPVAQREATGDWFDSVQGLATVRTLTSYLVAHPRKLKMPTHPSDVKRYRSGLLNELRLCETVIARAASSGRRFRLLLVP
jgi:hypothetical protein